MNPEEPRYVCHACIGDKVLTKQVEESTQAECSYCHLTKPAVTLAELSNRIHQVLEEHFEQIYMPPELPDDVPHPENYIWDQLPNDLEDIDTVIGKVANIPRRIVTDVRKLLFYRLAWKVNIEEGEENPYEYGTFYRELETDPTDYRLVWRDFREHVRSRARYFGTSTEGNLDNIFNNLIALNTYWGDTIIREIKPGGTDSSVWRGRAVNSVSELKSVLQFPARELGPPPSDKAKAGRMNAEGIPVFYGALEESTCLSEVRASAGSFVVLGRFDLLIPIHILDLEALSEVYSDISYFDHDYTEERSREGFLRELVGEISRPVIPHEETREYLATQIVSEYLANRVKPRLHGMTFPSSQTGGTGHNLVLFNWACGVEIHEPRPNTGIQVTIPRQPIVPSPWSRPSANLTVEAKGETRQSGEGAATSDSGRQISVREATLRLDETSVKVLTISGVKYQFENCPIQPVVYGSARPIRSTAMISKADGSTKNQV